MKERGRAVPSCPSCVKVSWKKKGKREMPGTRIAFMNNEKGATP
jgi:hypothetical protein